jgi:hypothetical protein
MPLIEAKNDGAMEQNSRRKTAGEAHPLPEFETRDHLRRPVLELERV